MMFFQEHLKYSCLNCSEGLVNADWFRKWQPMLSVYNQWSLDYSGVLVLHSSFILLIVDGSNQHIKSGSYVSSSSWKSSWGFIQDCSCRVTETESVCCTSFGISVVVYVLFLLSDQGAAKPSFSFLSSSSSSTVVPTTSANSSSVFGSAISSSNPQPVPTPFVFGQPSNTVSSSVFGNSSESAASQSFGFSQENKPATTSSSTGTGLTSFFFGSGASSTNAANSGFTFGATTTSSSTGMIYIDAFRFCHNIVDQGNAVSVRFYHGEYVGRMPGSREKYWVFAFNNTNWDSVFHIVEYSLGMKWQQHCFMQRITLYWISICVATFHHENDSFFCFSVSPVLTVRSQWITTCPVFLSHT